MNELGNETVVPQVAVPADLYQQIANAKGNLGDAEVLTRASVILRDRGPFKAAAKDCDELAARIVADVTGGVGKR